MISKTGKKLLIIGISISLVCLNAFSNPRKITVLDEGWKFIFEHMKNAQMPGFNDSDWETVSVPHDWAIDQPVDMNIDWQIVQVKADGESVPQLRTGRTGEIYELLLDENNWYVEFNWMQEGEE